MSSNLPNILLHGKAVSDGKTYYYKIMGKTDKRGIYILAIAVSDFTEEGTYIASFTLESLHASMLDNQEHAPSSLESALDWIIHAFGSAQSVTWKSEHPYLIAPYTIKLGSTQLIVDIRLPPDGCSFINNLSQVEAHRIYHQIVSSLYSAWSGVQQKLKECEEKKEQFTLEMHSQIILESESEKKRGDIFAIFNSVNGVAATQSSKSSHRPPSRTGLSPQNDEMITGRTSPIVVRRKNIVKPIRQVSRQPTKRPMGIQKKK